MRKRFIAGHISGPPKGFGAKGSELLTRIEEYTMPVAGCWR